MNPLHEALVNVVAVCEPLIAQSAGSPAEGVVPYDKTAYPVLIREIGNLLTQLGNVELI